MIRFRAQLELRPASEPGSRSGPIRSGYRPMMAHNDGYVSAAFDLVGVSELQPGAGAEAVVHVPSLTLQDWTPQAGDRFEVFETPGRPVAQCTVLALDAAAKEQPAELISAAD